MHTGTHWLTDMPTQKTHAHRQTHSHPYTDTHICIDRQTDRHKHTHTHRQTDTNTHKYIEKCNSSEIHVDFIVFPKVLRWQLIIKLSFGFQWTYINSVASWLSFKVIYIKKCLDDDLAASFEYASGQSLEKGCWKSLLKLNNNVAKAMQVEARHTNAHYKYFSTHPALGCVNFIIHMVKIINSCEKLNRL